MRHLQEKFDQEELDPYTSLVKQYSSTKEAEGYTLKEDDWVCEYCKTINVIPKYTCKKCYRDNDLIKEMAYQKMMLERTQTRKVRDPAPYSYKPAYEAPTNTFKPANRFDYLKQKWTCRFCLDQRLSLEGF